MLSVPESVESYNRSLRLLRGDELEAFRLNQAAAAEGMHDAVLAMGWFYLNGVGVDVDEESAVRWYKRSARQGDPRAMFSLGQIAQGSKDYSEALVWFKRATDKGHHRSGYWVGKLYWRGLGLRRIGKRHPSISREQPLTRFLKPNGRCGTFGSSPTEIVKVSQVLARLPSIEPD